MRLRLGLTLALAMAQPVTGEPAGCPMLVDWLKQASGLIITAPPAPDVDGWCVLDGVRTTVDGAVRVSADRLRLRGETVDGGLAGLEIKGKGVRLAPALNNRDMPDWLRDLVRLQSADLHLAVQRDAARDVLVVQTVQLRLSGGSEILVMGEVAGGDLGASSLLTARLTKLSVEWQNDGRLLAPILEAWGRGLEPGSSGPKALRAARSAIEDVVAALPEGTVTNGLPEGMDGFIAALPHGRGRLMLTASSQNGIGAAQLGLLALSEDPTAPAVLARFLSGTQVGLSWTPGLLP